MVSLEESKNFFIQETESFRNDLLETLIAHSDWDEQFLIDTISILKSGQQLNDEYKFHILVGRRLGKCCVHIPDPNAYTLNSFGQVNKYSDWLLVYDKDEKKNKIILEETGTHEYLRNKQKTCGKKK